MAGKMTAALIDASLLAASVSVGADILVDDDAGSKVRRQAQAGATLATIRPYGDENGTDYSGTSL